MIELLKIYKRELEDLRQKNTELQGSNARHEEECTRLREDLDEAEAEQTCGGG